MDERFEPELAVEQKMEPSMVARKESATGPESVRVGRGGSDPRSASADVDETGVIEDSISGRASPKDSSELRAAQTLVQHLNANGVKWQPAQVRTGREDGVDCIALGDGGAKLEMQMTTPERAAWAALAQSTKFERNETVDDAVEAVRVAIAEKKSKAHPKIVLVIDAADSPRHALKSVADRFRQLHASEANSCGFAAVWLIGPVPGMVYRLDA